MFRLAKARGEICWSHVEVTDGCFFQLVWLMMNLFLLTLTGGLICRGILSTLSDHNVQSFISLSSPQAGQYGGGFNFNKLSTWLCRSSCGGCCYHNHVSKIASSPRLNHLNLLLCVVLNAVWSHCCSHRVVFHMLCFMACSNCSRVAKKIRNGTFNMSSTRALSSVHPPALSLVLSQTQTTWSTSSLSLSSPTSTTSATLR